MTPKLSKQHPEPPGYRVRLFLAVDVIGSTKIKYENNEETWRKEFRNFYTSFPGHLEKAFVERATELHSQEHKYPQVWRTRGDEIIFVVSLRSTHHLVACLAAVQDAIRDFTSRTSFISLKANAWVAAFPTPNLPVFTGNRKLLDSVPDIKLTEVGEDLDSSLHSELIEDLADKYPAFFDFLGNEVDAGFRIAKNASQRLLTISPGLAHLIYGAYRKRDCPKSMREIMSTISIERFDVFKGVQRESEYPVIGLKIRPHKVETDLHALMDDVTPARGKAKKGIEYLDKFFTYHSITPPTLPLYCSGKLKDKDKPNDYHDYIKRWQESSETALPSMNENSYFEEQVSKDAPTVERKVPWKI